MLSCKPKISIDDLQLDACFKPDMAAKEQTTDYQAAIDNLKEIVTSLSMEINLKKLVMFHICAQILTHAAYKLGYLCSMLNNEYIWHSGRITQTI